jgi:hypothetical protein
MTVTSSAGTQSGARWCMYSSGDQLMPFESGFQSMGAAADQRSADWMHVFRLRPVREP